MEHPYQLRNFQKILQAPVVKKSVKQRIKKRLGLPPARNIGSKDMLLQNTHHFWI